MATRIDKALRVIRTSETLGTGSNEGSLGAVIMQTISGLIFFVGAALIRFGDAVTFLVSNPIRTLGKGIGQIFLAFTARPAAFIGRLFLEATVAVQTGAWQQLGPFLPILGAITFVGVAGVFTWYLDRTDSDLPLAGVDVPVIGESREEPGDDEG